MRDPACRRVERPARLRPPRAAVGRRHRLDEAQSMAEALTGTGFIMQSAPDVEVTGFETDEFDLLTNELRRIAEAEGLFLN